MNKLLSPLLCIALSISAAAADPYEVSITYMNEGSSWADEPVPVPANAPVDELSLVVLSGNAAAIHQDEKGLDFRIIRLLICNRTSKEISISTCERTLLLVQEAQDEKGVWKPIESPRSSWCGNSYFPTKLAAGQAFPSIAIKYTGTFKTKLRFKLLLSAVAEDAIYSREFEGSINPWSIRSPTAKVLGAP